MVYENAAHNFGRSVPSSEYMDGIYQEVQIKIEEVNQLKAGQEFTQKEKQTVFWDTVSRFLGLNQDINDVSKINDILHNLGFIYADVQNKNGFNFFYPYEIGEEITFYTKLTSEPKNQNFSEVEIYVDLPSGIFNNFPLKLKKHDELQIEGYLHFLEGKIDFYTRSLKKLEYGDFFKNLIDNSIQLPRTLQYSFSEVEINTQQDLIGLLIGHTVESEVNDFNKLRDSFSQLGALLADLSIASDSNYLLSNEKSNIGETKVIDLNYGESTESEYYFETEFKSPLSSYINKNFLLKGSYKTILYLEYKKGMVQAFSRAYPRLIA